MRTRFVAITVLTTAAAVVASIAIGIEQAGRESTGLEIRDWIVARQELRLLVETYRVKSPVFSHSSKVTDANGYLVVIDLAADKPFVDRAAVFGPLWDVRGPRSAISFDVGVGFTEQDAKAARQTPVNLFDHQGTLHRLMWDNQRNMTVRDSLMTGHGGGAWKREGDVRPVDDEVPFLSDDRALSPSGRFMLLFQRGEATLVDRLTGNIQEDPWLTGCFAHARSIQRLENVSILLPDDLNHLVVKPHPIWNTGTEILKTFDLDGVTHGRGDVILVYSRPDPSPHVIRRGLAVPERLRDREPIDAFSIGGELYLFMADEGSLRLYTPDGTKEMLVESDGDPVWPAYPYLQMQHLSQEDELAIFDASVDHGSAEPKQVIDLTRWNYHTGKVRHYEMQLADLFMESKGRLRPRVAIEVKELHAD